MATKKKTAKPEPESSIKTAWLIWIGSEFYKGMTDWSDEAIALGISKRLPNAAMARQIAEEGSVVFVAHDEGETDSCAACEGHIECPTCRKRIGEMAGLRKAVDNMLNGFKGDFETEAPRSLKRFKEVREKAIFELEAECSVCDDCGGSGKLEGGTGGKVKLVDGRVWDYRTYNYWLHQPTKFHPETMVEERDMCETCGGTGELPNARIFGMFAPERIEYIARGDESKEDLKKLKGFTIVRKSALEAEAKRKCGVRKPGGVYAVTTATGKAGAALLDEAVKAGLIKPSGAEVHGSFIRFGRPVPVAEKRFRGLKKIELKKVRDAVDQAEMVKDALAD